MIALHERLGVAIDVIEDHRDQVSDVSFFSARGADIFDQHLEPRPVPDTTTAVLTCGRASGRDVDPEDDIFRHRRQNGVA